MQAGLGVTLEWRKVLVKLREAGWGILDKQGNAIQRFRNCPPSLFVTEDVAAAPLPCHHPEICPWCYGRYVKMIFRTVQKAIQPGDRLLWTTGRFYEPMRKGNKRTSIQRHRSVLQGLAKSSLPSCRGVHWMLTAEPYTRYNVDKFRVIYRMLAILKSGARLHHLPVKWRGQTLSQLNEKKIVTAIARALRYPEYLFRGEPKDVVNILHARSRLRLSESYGCFRGRTLVVSEGAREEGGESHDHPSASDHP